MKRKRLKNTDGYSLFELVVVIVIMGIITAVSLRSMRNTTEVTRTEETRAELDALAAAIAGNPDLISGGNRTDYGYLGDIGSLPSSLSQLVTNPGYATWDGPYVGDEFTAGGADDEYQYDAWGQQYSYSGGVTISSTGSGSTITRDIAGSAAELTLNAITTVITDLSHDPPGSIYRDSVKAVLIYPNGTGSTSQRTKYPGSDGLVQFDSIPIGRHTLWVIYVPTNDTLKRAVSVDPGAATHLETQMHDDLW
ncbi:MAG: prepilin-type N-terminal cleavage/methylation domain-containing protein [candidate division Zixibacteria bacterium]|nr:prepilin-type N-terminal cleavage/methylation domain-containing protein [candidate division Zixibacteria bacterium]